MTTDIRLNTSFSRHPKRKRLEKLLGIKGILCLIDLWLVASQHRSDGILRGWDPDDIAYAAGWEDDPAIFVDALVKCGFLDIDSNQTYILHNWQKHQGWCVGSEDRSNRARITALIKHHGKEAGCKIAAEKFGINPADYGFESKVDEIQTACETHASSTATRMQSSDAPSPSPTPSPLPIPSPSPPPTPSPSVKLIPLSNDKGIVADDKILPCPHEKIINAYHSILPALPQVRAWPDNSRKNLRSRWRESPERQSIEFWVELFKFISKSKFLMGVNDRGWKPDLLWIVKPTNFAKILNGSYHYDKKLDEYRKFIERG